MVKERLTYHKLIEHAEHEIAIVRYGTKNCIYSVTIECLDCNETFITFLNIYEMLDNSPQEVTAL